MFWAYLFPKRRETELVDALWESSFLIYHRRPPHPPSTRCSCASLCSPTFPTNVGKHKKLSANQLHLVHIVLLNIQEMWIVLKLITGTDECPKPPCNKLGNTGGKKGKSYYPLCCMTCPQVRIFVAYYVKSISRMNASLFPTVWSEEEQLLCVALKGELVRRFFCADALPHTRKREGKTSSK